MKINKNQLKSMIMEELQSVMSEMEYGEGTIDDLLAAGPRPPDTTFKGAGGYTYAPDIARGGFYVKGPDGKTSHARAGSAAAKSIQAEMDTGTNLYKQPMVRSQDPVGRAGSGAQAGEYAAAPMGYTPGAPGGGPQLDFTEDYLEAGIYEALAKKLNI